MHIVQLTDVGKEFVYKWPGGTENYDYFVEYAVLSDEGEHTVKIGITTRKTYSKDRLRIVVWIDNNPDAEFFEADDFSKSGDVLSEIKVPGNKGERTCKYPDEPVPARYAMFNVVGMPNRVTGKGVHKSWAVVANIADHRTLVALAALRRLERRR